MGSSNVLRKVADLTSVGMIAKGRKRSRKQAKERRNASQQIEQERLDFEKKIQEEQEKTEIAQESVRKQKEASRKRTIFAGEDIQSTIFKKILGG